MGLSRYPYIGTGCSMGHPGAPTLALGALWGSSGTLTLGPGVYRGLWVPYGAPRCPCTGSGIHRGLHVAPHWLWELYGGPQVPQHWISGVPRHPNNGSGGLWGSLDALWGSPGTLTLALGALWGLQTPPHWLWVLYRGPQVP